MSHVLDPGDAWKRSWLAGAASQSRRPAHQPGESHQGCHAEVHPSSDLAAKDFPSHAVCTAGSAKVCCCPDRPPFEAGWWYFRAFLKKPAADHR